MKMYETTQPVERYLNIPLECACGRTHFAPIKAVCVGPGALKKLPEYMKQFGHHSPYILCDPITVSIAGEECARLLKDAGYCTSLHVLKNNKYDEATLGEIVINVPEECDVMIGVGTGQISDILRYSSFKLGINCFTIATAAPMDGFSASAGIMNVDNLKATMPAHASEVIIGDTDILTSAPYRMTIAGFGDLIGKLNSLNDWKLGHIVNGEHYCESIASAVSDYVHSILKQTTRIKNHAPEAIGEVMNALLFSGATVSLYGTSRAISGAEHHMSHYWETLGEQRGKPFAMHGEQVAVATVLALSAAKELAARKPDFSLAREKARKYDPVLWEADIRRVYGNAADAILELEKKSGKNQTEGRLRRITAIEKKWPIIRNLLEDAYSPEELRDQLKDVGCPCDPKDIGISAEILKDTFLFCKETRSIFTLYQMIWDIGLMDDISDVIIDRLKSQGRIESVRK